MTNADIIHAIVYGAIPVWFLLIDPAMRQDSYGERKK